MAFFVYFLRTHEVAKFSMIKLYLNISDVIYASKYRKYANRGLPVNFSNFLMKRIILSKSYYFNVRFPLTAIYMIVRVAII